MTKNNYLIAHSEGLDPINFDNVINRVDGHLNYAFIYDSDFNLYYTATFQQRDPYSCVYSYLSQGFACPGYGTTQARPMYITFSGIDQMGNAFERYAETQCTGTAYCANGFLYDGRCICSPYWEGPSCTVPICLYGGVPNGGGCTCPGQPPYLTGPNCQYPICEPQKGANFNDTGVTLAIVLETTIKTGNAIYYLKYNLKKILDNVMLDTVTSSKWISNYILYPFDSNANQNYWYPVVISNTTDAIQSSLDNITQYLPNLCPGSGGTTATCESGSNCSRPIFGVLLDLMTRAEFKGPNSVVLVITTSSPNDYGAYVDTLTVAQSKRALVELRAFVA